MAAAPIRVLHLVGAGKPGGAEAFALRLIIAQNKQPQLSIRVIAKQGGWLAQELRKAGVNVTEAPFGGLADRIASRFGYGTARVVRGVTVNFLPQIVQSWMNRATGFMPGGPWKKVARLGGFYKLKNYFNKVEYIIGNTKDIVDYCIKGGWPEERAMLLENFVSAPTRTPAPHLEKLRRSLKIPAKAVVLGAFGRLHPVKGLDLAIEALAKLPPHVHLLLVGEGTERRALEGLAQRRNIARRVHFAGWVNEISAHAQLVDIWLVPSRHEPLGNTVIDGWAHHKPVVASKTHGPVSLIKNGKSGLLVETGSAEALQLAISKILTEKGLGKLLVEGGRATYSKRFTEEVVVKRYVDYYARLMKKEKRT